MKVELIAVGNELLNGKIKDLNGHYLSQEVFKENKSLQKVHLVPDNENQIFRALDSAKKNADIIILSGGLGPTKDDLTKSLLAKYFSKEIKPHEEALNITKHHFERRNRVLDLNYIKYNEIPEDFMPLENSVGFAPGLKYQLEDGTLLFALPGVPTEFQAMIKDHILPHLNESHEYKKHIIVKTWRLPESKIFNEVCPGLWEELEKFGEVSSLPHPLNVDIGVSLTASSKEELKQKEADVLRVINKTELTKYIWHIGNESLEEVIINEALKRKITFGFAESCTGGLLASRITDISGCSSVFWGSVISYANEVKMKSLNVKEETLKNHGAVSEQTALEMATGAKDHLAVDIAVTTTGVAGPGGGSKEKPVGTVGIGIASKFTEESKIYHFHGERVPLKFRFSQMALFKLLEEVRKF